MKRSILLILFLFYSTTHFISCVGDESDSLSSENDKKQTLPSSDEDSIDYICTKENEEQVCATNEYCNPKANDGRGKCVPREGVTPGTSGDD